MSGAGARMPWWGWGDPAQALELSPDLARLARQALGISARSKSTARARRPPALAPPRLAEPMLARLRAIVGAEHVRLDSRERLAHLRGKSTPDLLRIRAGDARGAPDAVLTPDGHEQVSEVLGLCAAHRVAVVPFGGGTSVVGGLEPDAEGHEGLIALDLSRMARLLELDEVSRTATLEPGLRGPQAEQLLGARGYTIGHHPQSYEFATLGGFAATRSSGQASAGYGRFDELVLGLRLATPRGTLELGRAPRSATGPDLRQLILGSEGAFGVITALRVAIRPLPAARRYRGWRLPSFDAGLQALRRLAQDGPQPTVLRLSDEAETALGAFAPAARASAVGEPPDGGSAAEEAFAGGALAIVGIEGSGDEVEDRDRRIAALLRSCGAQPLAGAGEAWLADRYRAPYLRDALLDAGALVETLETATFWSRIPDLHRSVAEALRRSLSQQGSAPLVLCHVSHVYPAGASLYYTVAAAQLPDPLAQWSKAKRAATEAILKAGATISHHHGIGRDHRRALASELGELGVQALRALKAALDPDGILNPGVLVP